MVSMRLDKDDNVAVHAIHLCGHLLVLDMLEPEECVEVCELTFFENRAISHAAGDFAVKYLFSDDFMAKAKQARVPKGEGWFRDGRRPCSRIPSCREEETYGWSDHAERVSPILHRRQDT